MPLWLLAASPALVLGLSTVYASPGLALGPPATVHARLPSPVMTAEHPSRKAAPVPLGTFADAGLSGSVVPTNKNSGIQLQGGSLRTWSYQSPKVEQVQVVLTSEGRPVDADIELWQGPGNIPAKMRVYVENGALCPFSAVLETPRWPTTVAIRNIAQIEFPFAAHVFADDVDNPTDECLSTATTIQGGALRTYPFDPSVDSVQVLLQTDGRPLNARIELLQGPNNNKQVIELYAEDGCDRPFFCILMTPGAGHVVRVVNTAPVEFPMTASVVPDSFAEGVDQLEWQSTSSVVVDGGSRGVFNSQDTGRQWWE